MRVFSMQPHSSVSPLPPAADPAPKQSSAPPEFMAFSAQAFAQAHIRHVPVFLLIGDLTAEFKDPSLLTQLFERTVPVLLAPGVRPDVELLCQRASLLFSGESALPLCALLLDDARPFLAAPLPPSGFPIDPSRLFVWLSQADRRFTQNHAAFVSQATQVLRSFSAPALRKPFSPADAAHQLTRKLLNGEDTINGGFGKIKSPQVCALRFLQRRGIHGDAQVHAALTRALDAMVSSALYDPLDGTFFRATLTEDWRVFVPEKLLGINAMLALILLDSGKRTEAIRLLDSMVSAFSLEGGGLSPYLKTTHEACAFSPEQVCAALGSEDGLRACRLLSLLRQHTQPDPEVLPSRFSPVSPGNPNRDHDIPALCPKLSPSLTPEDAAFLRRVLPILQRTRAVRLPPQPASCVITEHCALAAAVLAQCGSRLGEPRYTQAAQRAVTFLFSQTPSAGNLSPLPASFYPVTVLHAQHTCGASAALALALLTLGSSDGMDEYAQSGLHLLGSALHAFVRQDGLVMHTYEDPADFFIRVPAIYDSELPSPAALLIHALHIAHAMRPQAHYDEAIETIWNAAAPAVCSQPLACLSLIDAANCS